MRDDSKKWDPSGVWGAIETADGLTVSPIQLARQTLISGCDVLAQTQHPVAVWPDIVTAETYALPLRRDRILLVNGPFTAEGWHEDSAQAVSDASDGYAVFEMSGKSAVAALRRGTELRFDVQSGSVARMLFGLNVLLYRFGADDRFRIHIARSQADTLLKACNSVLSAP